MLRLDSNSYSNVATYQYIVLPGRLLPSMVRSWCPCGGDLPSKSFGFLGGFGGVTFGSFRKLGVPYFGVLIIRIRVPYFRKPPFRV